MAPQRISPEPLYRSLMRQLHSQEHPWGCFSPVKFLPLLPSLAFTTKTGQYRMGREGTAWSSDCLIAHPQAHVNLTFLCQPHAVRRGGSRKRAERGGCSEGLREACRGISPCRVAPETGGDSVLQKACGLSCSRGLKAGCCARGRIFLAIEVLSWPD